MRQIIKYYTPEIPNPHLLVTLEFIVEIIHTGGTRDWLSGGHESCPKSEHSVKKMLKRGTIVQFLPAIPFETGKVPRLAPDGTIYYVTEEDKKPYEEEKKIGRIPAKYNVNPAAAHDPLRKVADEWMKKVEDIELDVAQLRKDQLRTSEAGEEWKRDTDY